MKTVKKNQKTNVSLKAIHSEGRKIDAMKSFPVYHTLVKAYKWIQGFVVVHQCKPVISEVIQ